MNKLIIGDWTTFAYIQSKLDQGSLHLEDCKINSINSISIFIEKLRWWIRHCPSEIAFVPLQAIIFQCLPHQQRQWAWSDSSSGISSTLIQFDFAIGTFLFSQNKSSLRDWTNLRVNHHHSWSGSRNTPWSVETHGYWNPKQLSRLNTSEMWYSTYSRKTFSKEFRLSVKLHGLLPKYDSKF